MVNRSSALFLVASADPTSAVGKTQDVVDLPTVLSVGGEPAVAAATSLCRSFHASCVDDALTYLERNNNPALVLADGLDAGAIRRLLERCGRTTSDSPPILIAHNYSDSAVLHEDADRCPLFFMSRGAMSAEQLGSVITAALNSRDITPKDNNIPSATSDIASCALEFSAALSSQPDLVRAATLIVDTVTAHLRASRGDCLLVRGAKLWSPQRPDPERQLASATRGIVGYVARTGRGVWTDETTTDPIFEANIDDPEGAGSVRLIAEPVWFGRGAPIAVITAIRDCDCEPFTSNDVATLRFFGCCAGAALAAFVIRDDAEADAQRGAVVAREFLFRREAWLFHTRRTEREGAMLLPPSIWARAAHWVTLGIVLMMLGYASVIPVARTVTGPAVIKAAQKVNIVARRSGVIKLIEAPIASELRTGDVIARLYETPGATPAERLTADLAAPRDGMLSELYVRTGQSVTAGDVVGSITDERTGYELIACLPGAWAPRLSKGLPLAIALDGHPDVKEVVQIATVGMEVIGPSDLLKYFGRDGIRADLVGGQSIIVRALLTGTTFTEGGRKYKYRDGMTATATARLGSEPLIVSLLPTLRPVFE